MKFLVLSDSHGNKFGLEAVLNTGRPYDRIICLGDVVGYGAHPNECCEILRERKAISLSGNHDAAVLGKIDVSWFNSIAQAAVVWTREHLQDENRVWLNSLPAQQVFEEWGFQIVHASLREPWEEYITEPAIAEPNFLLMEKLLCFFGHTHQALCAVAPADTSTWTRHDQMQWIELPFGAEIKLEASERVLLNPGSCGQPRDGNAQAKAALYDLEAQTIEVFGVEYDVEAARSAILKAGLPPRLGERLRKGQ